MEIPLNKLPARHQSDWKYLYSRQNPADGDEDSIRTEPGGYAIYRPYSEWRDRRPKPETRSTALLLSASKVQFAIDAIPSTNLTFSERTPTRGSRVGDPEQALLEDLRNLHW